jgi:hypothetical protein
LVKYSIIEIPRLRSKCAVGIDDHKLFRIEVKRNNTVTVKHAAYKYFARQAKAALAVSRHGRRQLILPMR